MSWRAAISPEHESLSATHDGASKEMRHRDAHAEMVDGTSGELTRTPGYGPVTGDCAPRERGGKTNCKEQQDNSARMRQENSRE